MACKNCQDPVATSTSQLTYSAQADHVRGKDGVARSVSQPLVDKLNRPRGGWKALLTIHGQTQLVQEEDPKLVFSKAKELLSLNSIGFTERDLWLNLNIQWIERANEAKQKVRLSDIMAITVGAPAQQVAMKNRENIPPAIWGRKGWGFLQQYLAQDTYDYGEFLQVAVLLHKMVNPTINPSCGCADCYVHFTKHLHQLRQVPQYTQRGAQEWLVAAMNAVNAKKGTPELTFEQAAKLNHWTS